MVIRSFRLVIAMLAMTIGSARVPFREEPMTTTSEAIAVR
jgi:hypothetical protein